MGDRFYKDIEVPDLPEGVELAPPDAGFIQVFGRNGKLATVNSAGEEVIHDGGGGAGGANGAPTFIEQNEVFTVANKYQVLFSSPIDCEGLLVADGLLIEVV